MNTPGRFIRRFMTAFCPRKIRKRFLLFSFGSHKYVQRNQRVHALPQEKTRHHPEVRECTEHKQQSHHSGENLSIRGAPAPQPVQHVTTRNPRVTVSGVYSPVRSASASSSKLAEAQCNLAKTRHGT